jgi:hypothetical protein
VKLSPPYRTSPADGSRSPIMLRRSVLFPQPLPPMMTKMSPRSTVNEIAAEDLPAAVGQGQRAGLDGRSESAIRSPARSRSPRGSRRRRRSRRPR